MTPTPRVLAAVALALALAAASCSSNEPTAVAEPDPVTGPAFTKVPPTTAVTTCGPGSGVTTRPDVLTIATDDPAYAPWFDGNDPSNGRGYEGAVAAEIAQRLGYSGDGVDFIRTSFADALAPGVKDFDFDINQVTIAEDRRTDVDLSTPYYAVAQAVVAMSGSAAAQAASLADLAEFRLGGQAGSTSLSAITDEIGAGTAPVEFATTDAAKAALVAGDVDAIVVDLPTGFQIVDADIPGSVLVGQFPQPNEVTEFFGVVLEKDSPMTECVSAAIDSLYADGELDRLAATWLSETTGAPALR